MPSTLFSVAFNATCFMLTIPETVAEFIRRLVAQGGDDFYVFIYIDSRSQGDAQALKQCFRRLQHKFTESRVHVLMVQKRPVDALGQLGRRVYVTTDATEVADATAKGAHVVLVNPTQQMSWDMMFDSILRYGAQHASESNITAEIGQ